jgi:predicted dehydrogenase
MCASCATWRGSFVGFYEADAARAAVVSAQLGVRAHASLDALLDECDAVSIVVPTTAHHAVARAALRRLHVFVEKPFTVTLEEADELLGQARTAGLVVQVGHVERFNRAVRAACHTWMRPASSRAIGWRRSIRAARMWRSCSTS